MPGPPPKRSDQRRRANAPAAGKPRKAPAGEVPVVPTPDPEWHPIARMFFEALPKSGQSAFYTCADWATAYTLAESISREFKPQPVLDPKGNPVCRGDEPVMVEIPPRAAALGAWAKLMSGLLVTEGDRRRVGLELEREEAGDPEVERLAELHSISGRLTG